MKVAVLQEHLSDGTCIAITQESILDDYASPATSLEHLDEMLHEHIGGFRRANLKVLQHFATLIASKGRIGKDDVLAVALLYLTEVHGKRVAMRDVGGRHAVKYHVHGGDDIGQPFLLLAEESIFLQGLMVPIFGSTTLMMLRIRGRGV